MLTQSRNTEPQHNNQSVTFGVAGRISFGFSQKTSKRKTAKIQVDSAHSEQWVIDINSEWLVFTTLNFQQRELYNLLTSFTSHNRGRNKEVTGSNQEPRG